MGLYDFTLMNMMLGRDLRNQRREDQQSLSGNLFNSGSSIDKLRQDLATQQAFQADTMRQAQEDYNASPLGIRTNRGVGHVMHYNPENDKWWRSPFKSPSSSAFDMWGGLGAPPAPPGGGILSLMKDPQILAVANSMIKAQNAPYRTNIKKTRGDARAMKVNERQLQGELSREQRRIANQQRAGGVGFAKAAKAAKGSGQVDAQRIADQLNSLSAGGYSPEAAAEMVAAQQGTQRGIADRSNAIIDAGVAGADTMAGLLANVAAGDAARSVDKRGEIDRSAADAVREARSAIAANWQGRPGQVAELAKGVFDSRNEAYRNAFNAWVARTEAAQALGNMELERAKAAAKGAASVKPVDRVALMDRLRKTIFDPKNAGMYAADYDGKTPAQIMNLLYPAYSSIASPQDLISAFASLDPTAFQGANANTRWDPKAQRFFRSGKQYGKG